MARSEIDAGFGQRFGKYCHFARGTHSRWPLSTIWINLEYLNFKLWHLFCRLYYHSIKPRQGANHAKSAVHLVAVLSIDSIFMGLLVGCQRINVRVGHFKQFELNRTPPSGPAGRKLTDGIQFVHIRNWSPPGVFYLSTSILSTPRRPKFLFRCFSRDIKILQQDSNAYSDWAAFFAWQQE